MFGPASPVGVMCGGDAGVAGWGCCVVEFAECVPETAGISTAFFGAQKAVEIPC